MPQSLRPEVSLARKLRKSMSLPEALLWQRLKGRPDGHKFRRQHPVGPYVVDFYNRAASLAIEVDGALHDTPASADADDRRDAFLRQNGLTVLRIKASDILRNPDEITASIVSRVASPLHQPAAGPPPRAGEDQE